MSARRAASPDDPLNGTPDAAIDREIGRLLSVEPGPHFVSRVRARVALEPAPARRWSGWPAAAAGLAVTTALVVAVVWGPALRSDPDAPLTTRSPDRRLPPTEAVVADPAGRPDSPGSVRTSQVVEPAVRDERRRSFGTTAADTASAERPATGLIAGRTSAVALMLRSGPATAGMPIFDAPPPAFLAVGVDDLDVPDVLVSASEQRAIRMLLNPTESKQDQRFAEAPAIVIPDLPALAALEVPRVEIMPLAQTAAAEGGRP